MHKAIKKKIEFFIKDYGYTYCHEHNRNLYHKCVFSNSNSSIVVEYDCRLDYLDLEISKDSEMVVKTSYGNVTWGDAISPDNEFSKSLKSIYSFEANQIYLSRQQFSALIELYARFASGVVGSWSIE